MQSYLILGLFKKKQIIYKNFNFLLYIFYEEEDLVTSYDNFLGFLTLHTSLWDKRYFIKHIILRNSINKDFYKFHELTTKKLLPIKKPYYKFFFKKKIFLKREQINIPRMSMRNWLTSDSSYVGSKMESLKFYTQVSRMNESRGNFVIFTKKEKDRIYKNIQTRNAFYGFGREMLANNVNYRYSEALATNLVLKIGQPLNIKKKKSLPFFLKEVQYNLFSISYILFNMKSTVRDRIAKPYLPYFGINFLSSIIPYFHGYPTFKKKIRSTHPIFFSSMKNYTGFLFEDILKSILNLNNTSYFLSTLKNSNFFFDKKYLVFPTLDSSTKVFLRGYLNIEDWYPLSTGAIPYPGADCYFSQFIPNKLISSRVLDSLQNTVLKKNVSFFLNLFTNKSTKPIKKKQKYSTTSIMGMRNFVLLKNQRKKIFILNQSSYIPDFMGYFRSKKEPYHRLGLQSILDEQTLIKNYLKQNENKSRISEGYSEAMVADEEEVEEDEILDKYEYSESKFPVTFQDYCVLIVADHIYNWATLELKKSLGETVEKTPYLSPQTFMILREPVCDTTNMTEDIFDSVKWFLEHLEAFEADYIKGNGEFSLANLYSDEGEI